MNKIKVSKEVAEALDAALKAVDKEEFFEEHSNKLNWTLDIYLPLNQISNWKMAQILINGYEIEETPEEKLLKLYNFNADGSGFSEGYKLGMIHTLNNLKIKIKGIND